MPGSFLVDDAAPRPARSTAVTIGNFDGVHLGHRRLIEATRAAAGEGGLESVALTFEPHPATVVRPDRVPRLLTGTAHKLELLDASGIDAVAVLRFDAARAAESAEDFVNTVLAGALGVAAVLVGRQFRFGHRQRGDVALLTALGEELGFAVTETPLFEVGGEPLSSSRIRRLIEAGALDEAAALLGRPHELRGSALLRRSGAVRLETPSGLLVPPPGEYLGEIAGGRGAFAPARVQVTALPDGSRQVEAVLEASEPGFLAPPGSALAVRFGRLDTVAAPTSGASSELPAPGGGAARR